ncbi:MAG: CheR family methyltransferase [Sulfurimonadaceae bacterium]|jgi:chemotaxis protein methyltransferase CheR|nr:CheR family methyltransferase [Sulfurimonadaceae bacterium]
MLRWLFPKKEIQKEEIEHTSRTEDFTNINPIADFFKNLSGVTFDKQLSILESKTRSFCRHRNIYSYKELHEKINYDHNLKQELINHLTTNETFFYREFAQIEELVALVKKESSKVSILCAPCATGEESYSIAIALLEAGVESHQFEILGIDINSLAIERAKVASYRERNIKNLPQPILSRYFFQNEDRYELKDVIKNLVDFRVINIFDPSFTTLGKFDYIFSRNMLIYFDMPTKQKAKKILESIRKDTSKKIFFGHADLF